MTSSNGRPCSVCSSVQLRDISLDLASGASVSLVSQQYGLSTHSLYRHLRNGHGLDAQQITVLEGLGDATDALERITEIANNARQTRRVALASGNVLNATRASDSELKALQIMTGMLGIRDSSIITALHETQQLVEALAKIIGRHPQIGESLAELLDHEGAHDLASSFRLLKHRALELKKEK